MKRDYRSKRIVRAEQFFPQILPWPSNGIKMAGRIASNISESKIAEGEYFIHTIIGCSIVNAGDYFVENSLGVYHVSKEVFEGEFEPYD